MPSTFLMHTKPLGIAPAYLSTFLSRHPRARYTETFSCHFSSTRMFSNRGSPSSKHPSVYMAGNCQAQGRDPSRAPFSHGAPRPQLQEAQHYHPNPIILPGARGCASLTNLPKGRHPRIVCGFNERATTGSTTDVKNPRDVCTSGWQRGWPLGKGAALGDGLGGREDPRRSVGRARGRRLRSRHPPRGAGAGRARGLCWPMSGRGSAGGAGSEAPGRRKRRDRGLEIPIWSRWSPCSPVAQRRPKSSWLTFAPETFSVN